MADHWNLGFVGAGVMAETMIAGVLDGVGFAAERIAASGPREERRAELNERYGIQVTDDNTEVAASSDLLVLSVKPQSLREVLDDLQGKVQPGTTVLSIVAGASLSVISHGLLHERVARAMPNLPCRIRQGITVWTGNGGVDEARIGDGKRFELQA